MRHPCEHCGSLYKAQDCWWPELSMSPCEDDPVPKRKIVVLAGLIVLTWIVASLGILVELGLE